MEPATEYNKYHDVRLIFGCHIENMHCITVASMLNNLAEHVDLKDGVMYLRALVDLVNQTASLLYRLGEYVWTYRVHRGPQILPYLQIFLPSLRKTLVDIGDFYRDSRYTKSKRWRCMYHHMTEDVHMSLPRRFELYNNFLGALSEFLLQHISLELSRLESLKECILTLRKGQKIDPPLEPMDELAGPGIAQRWGGDLHWAEKIFTMSLHSRTPLKGSMTSWVSDISSSSSKLPLISMGSKVLFRREFNAGRLILTAHIENNSKQLPVFTCRNYKNGQAISSVRSLHDVNVQRHGKGIRHGLTQPLNSLCVRYFSRSRRRLDTWMILTFDNWEELVLMWTTCHVLKCLSNPKPRMTMEEFQLDGEEELFQGVIIDANGVYRSLCVLEETKTGGRRLYCAVYEGPQIRCTIWTAFITHVCRSPTWLEQRSDRRVYLKDLQLYVFSNDFDEQAYRRTPGGVFQVDFRSEDACKHFVALLAPQQDAKMLGAS
ncbi:hypothetical protein CFIMG_002863RA [Ceratocystis fimbriata CBS 114723]|uniref:Uncharacterized protein n=1 Tax=Ceratocystis fimbriata CBS 114723 TaxID=1035309 RepID=A0A2C5X385_9PEZI|nr:hypothetical protein CFIMG_002863RA [Ceratocystis fimbriata CBS 114723]